jgi:hypothetical protein
MHANIQARDGQIINDIIVENISINGERIAVLIIIIYAI